MNVAAPQSPLLQWLYRGYMLAFLAYLAAPLFAAGMFAFNDSMFPALPWNGFTLDWFFSSTEPKIGMFHDRRLLRGLENSLYIGVIVSALAVAAGTSPRVVEQKLRSSLPASAAAKGGKEAKAA